MSSVARYEHHGPYYGGKQATILCSSDRLPRRVLDYIFLRRCKRCNTRTNNRRRVWYETVPSAAPVAACDHQKGLLFYFILSMVQSELDELVGTRRTPRPGNPSPAQAAARGGTRPLLPVRNTKTFQALRAWSRPPRLTALPCAGESGASRT